MSNIIDSLCMTWRHDYGLYKPDDDDSISSGMTTAERESLRRRMAQLHAHHIAPLEERIRELERASQPGSGEDDAEYEQYIEFAQDGYERIANVFKQVFQPTKPMSGVEIVGMVCELLRCAGSENVDAARWRVFERALRTGYLQGAGYGRRFKIIETCPMYGDEKEFNAFIEAIDAARASLDGRREG